MAWALISWQAIDTHFAIAGFIVGALVGVTGVGGGSLMTPILILLFGVSPATAVGTDLLFAAATKTVGSLVHGFNRTIEWRVVRRLATGSLPATAFALFALSLLLGILVTFSSVGAGAIGVTALVLLYPGIPMARIVGSDIAHAVPLTLIAGLGHGAMGSFSLHTLLSLLVGSFPGIFVGSSMSARIPDFVLRYVLAGVRLIVGARLALDVPGHVWLPSGRYIPVDEAWIWRVDFLFGPAKTDRLVAGSKLSGREKTGQRVRGPPTKEIPSLL
jgi:uncharacterized membrane protein YfcA